MDNTESSATSVEQSPFEVGHRIQVGEQRGTVLYVGSVPPTQGIWLGVDWDDPSRGKHDGVYEGVRYFKARYPVSASFVRPFKASPGQNILTAIGERYQKVESDNKILAEVQRATNAPFLMMVGFDKVAEQQRFDSLVMVGVREMRVSCSGPPGGLREMCPKVEELDLSRNLLVSWRAVYEIVVQLPNLRLLDVSENRLSYELSELDNYKEGFRNVKCLFLSKMEITWTDVLNLSTLWPNLETFQVSYNNITSLDPPPFNLLQNLRVLNIEGNSIKSWSQVQLLGVLPKLEVLNLSNIGLSSISISTPVSVFLKLKYLLLSGNDIISWTSINELDKLPSLEELKIKDNPLLEGLPKENARQLLIAHISRLKLLNAQEISHEERRGAEYDYLKQFGLEWLNASNNEAAELEFCQRHPRYKDLIQKYGVVQREEVEAPPRALKSGLLSVTFTSLDMTITKKLPPRMTIQKLEGLVQKLFNIRATPTLVLISKKNPSVQEPLDNGIKELSYYSIEDGDQIIVKW